MASSPKKVLFKEFACERRSKFSEKYPFLTDQQIQAKLKHSWKKTCQENKKTVKLYRSQKKRSLHQKSGMHRAFECPRLCWKFAGTQTNFLTSTKEVIS
jgi:hypothetical protein